MAIRERLQEFSHKAYVKITDFFMNGGMGLVFGLALFAMLLAIVGHYGQMGFNWKWFVFFELPLYSFCAWALYKAFKVWNEINNGRR